ncbi:antirestriction protein ArdA [Nocardia brasiliensis]|uniref:antirestriction protein ArdA n=1 Tax=Nocardia brasiliensis TaxID=37326 RepID=UPI003D931F8B
MNEQFPRPKARIEPPSDHEPEALNGADALAEREVSHEQRPQLHPRIYVTRGLPLRAELTDGTWVDMARKPRDIYAEMHAVLAADEATEAIPLYIWDYDGFGAFEVTTGAVGLEGVDSIELLAQIARGIKEHGSAYAAYASAHEDDPARLDHFAIAYKGQHESIAAYVQQLFEPLKIEEMLRRAAPDGLQDFVCIDYAAVGDEMVREGDIVVFPADEGGVWVFEEGA